MGSTRSWADRQGICRRPLPGLPIRPGSPPPRKPSPAPVRRPPAPSVMGLVVLVSLCPSAPRQGGRLRAVLWGTPPCPTCSFRDAAGGAVIVWPFFWVAPPRGTGWRKDTGKKNVRPEKTFRTWPPEAGDALPAGRWRIVLLPCKSMSFFRVPFCRHDEGAVESCAKNTFILSLTEKQFSLTSLAEPVKRLWYSGIFYKFHVFCPRKIMKFLDLFHA